MPPPVNNDPPRPSWMWGDSNFEGPLVDRLFRVSLPSFVGSDFSGQTFLVIFNPKARLNPKTGQGQYASEAPVLRRNLESMGARVVFLETDPNPAVRTARIREAAASLFAEPNVGPIHVLPVGGDGTVDEALRGVIENITGPLRLVPSDSDINEAIRQRIDSGAALRVGTAGDIGSQLGSPPPRLFGLRSLLRRATFRSPLSPFSRVAEFYRGSQTIPMSFPTVETEVAPGRTAFHSVGFGTSGYLFTQAETNRRADPHNFFNRGLPGYFRVLPQAIREYGLRGVEAEIEHHGRVDRFRIGELLGSSNRIVAAAGGIPGRWGEFRLLAIPNGPPGVFVMGESMFRGLLTQVGINMVGTMKNAWATQLAFRMARAAAGRFGIRFDFNLVGADSVLWSLQRERQITLRPGERARVRFFDPETRAPVEVPWQLNGDSVPRSTHEAEIYVPPVTVPMRVAPGAVALKLYQQDELRRGLSLSDGYEPPLPIARHVSPPSYISRLNGGVRTTSAFYPSSDLRALINHFDLEPQRLPLLVARAHGVRGVNDLYLLQDKSLSMEGLERWVFSEEGRAQIAADRALLGDTFRNRLETVGVGLGLGLATLYASDRLATRLGIDPERDRLLHFATVALASHGMNQVGNAVTTTLVNRAQGIPFDWAAVETQGVRGLWASRMVYEMEPSILRGMGISVARNLGFQAGAESLMLRGAAGLVRVPFHMAWGMGLGLFSSRMTDSLLSNVLPEDSGLRQTAASVAFFAPSIYHLLAGNRGLAILESTSVRRLNAVFSAGFIADLAFTAGHSLYYGDRASYERFVNHRASELRDREEGVSWFSIDRAFELISPELAAWVDTLDVFGGRHNPYYQRIIESDRRYVQEGSNAVRAALTQQLIFGNEALAQTADFYRRVDLTELGDLPPASQLEHRMAQYLRTREGEDPTFRQASLELRAEAVRRQFSGLDLSRDQVRQILRRIEWRWVRTLAGGVAGLDLPGSLPLQRIFDSQGHLAPFSQQSLHDFLTEGNPRFFDQILETRRASLRARIEESRLLAEQGDPQAARTLQRLSALAEEVGVTLNNPS